MNVAGGRAAVLVILVSLGVLRAQADAPELCAVVAQSSGEVKVLDRDRTHLVVAEHGLGVTCGGWISVRNGWVRVRYRNGVRIQLGNQSFAHFPDSKSKEDSPYKEDHVVLFKGVAYSEADGGMGELKMATASGRARIRRGKMIVVFSPGESETQVVGIKDRVTLENRFQPQAKMEVGPGEATSVNFDLKRVSPTLPAAISVAGLKVHLEGLQLSASDESEAIRGAVTRNQRKLAAALREPASVDRVKGDYDRHRRDRHTAGLHAQLIKKTVGGEEVGEQILFPDKYYGKSQRVRITIEDPAAQLNAKVKQREDGEKKRLIEELSSIRVD